MEKGGFSFEARKITLNCNLSAFEGQSFQGSNEKKAPGCLGYIRDYTTQVYVDYNKPFYKLYKDPYKTTSISWKVHFGVSSDS